MKIRNGFYIPNLTNPNRDWRCNLIYCPPQDYANQLKAFYDANPDADVWDIIKSIHVAMVPAPPGLVLAPGQNVVPSPSVVCLIYYSLPKKNTNEKTIPIISHGVGVHHPRTD